MAKTSASLLPQNIGIGIATDDALSIAFDSAMDSASVQSGLQLHPHQPFELRWSEDRTTVEILAERLWRTDERYVIVIDADAARADGTQLGEPQRYSFTTQTAPVVDDFQVRLAGVDLLTPVEAQLAAAIDPLLKMEGGADLSALPELDPTTTARDVSATSAISVSFSGRMDHADLEERFAITPAIAGNLSWDGDVLTFTPTERLVPGTRYTISVVGAHDVTGNEVGGKANFSFVVAPGAQLTRVRPGLGETNVVTETVEMWFSQPMDVDATNAAFSLVDTTTQAAVAGTLEWNAAGTQLTFTPDDPFLPGRRFDVQIGDGAQDVDGNAVTRTWAFTTQFAAVAQRSTTSTRTSRPVVPPPAPASDMNVYALNQINAARGAYGFAPVVLDASISAVAYAHAYDQAVNGYFSHVSLDGRTRDDRLRAGGVSFSWSGENQCYLVGRSVQSTLDWCHAQFMAEPYPGQFNHIANVLSPNATRVGVGIAVVGARIVVVWDFAN